MQTTLRKPRPVKHPKTFNLLTRQPKYATDTSPESLDIRHKELIMTSKSAALSEKIKNIPFDHALMKRINDTDLSEVKIVLEGYSKAELDELEKGYKQFLYLTLAYPDLKIVPDKAIDELWHKHILDTRAYAADCTRIAGEFLHHNPYFGVGGKAAAQKLNDAFELTELLRTHVFAEDAAKSILTAAQKAQRSRKSESSCSRCVRCVSAGR